VSAVDTSIIFEILREGSESRLQVRRVFDQASIDFVIPRPDERIIEIRQRLPAAIEHFRSAVGPRDSCELSFKRAETAALRLDRLAFSILDLLLVGSRWTARQFTQTVADHIRPAFRNPSHSGGAAPIIELRSSAAEPLARLLPLEFMPVADTPHSENTNPDVCFAHRMSRYMGFRSIIVRNLRSDKTRIPRDTNGRLALHIVTYQDSDLPGIIQQRRFFRSRRRDFNVIKEWPDLTKVARDEAPDGLAAIIHQLDAGLLHICCHFRPAGPDNQGRFEPEPFLEFEGSGKFIGSSGLPLRVRLIDLRGALAQLEIEARHPAGEMLVFANACRSALMEGTGESLVSFLMEKQYEQLIGSEGLLPDRVAGEFAVRFYTALLRGSTAGEAILTARRDLLERYSNPAGLLYTGHCDPELTFESLPAETVTKGVTS